MRPDFRNFRGVGLDQLFHSAKGSTWEDHKYIKRIDGTYYYPDSYEGGRHLPDSSNNKSKEKEESEGTYDLDKNDIESLAKEVIRGNFGNGQIRKDLLGDLYQEVQNRVNELMRSSTGSKKLSEVTKEAIQEGAEIIQKAVNSATKKSSTTQASKGLNMEKVYDVYRKK